MTNIHDNSRKALKEVIESGLFSEQQQRTLQELIERGPGTNREIDARIGHGGRSWHPVLHNLEKMGVVVVTGSRPCTITGRTAMVYAWDGLGGFKPLPERKRPSLSQFAGFLDEIGTLLDDAGHRLSPQAQEVWDWLVAKYWTPGKKIT